MRPPQKDDSGLQSLIDRGVFSCSEGPGGDSRVSLARTSGNTFGFLCSLVWPFVDSYWVAVVALSVLPHEAGPAAAVGEATEVARVLDGGVMRSVAPAAAAAAARADSQFVSVARLTSRMQWLAETLYHDRKICFYESCSLETLGGWR